LGGDGRGERRPRPHSADALDRRDVELDLSVASPEIELINPASPLEGPSIGHEGVRQFFEEAEAFAESSSVEVDEITAVGSRVLALFTLTTVGRVSGTETTVDLAGVYSFEDAKISRAHIFTDRHEALEAARAPE
jgi:ketosteroid isomerase-like protein